MALIGVTRLGDKPVDVLHFGTSSDVSDTMSHGMIAFAKGELEIDEWEAGVLSRQLWLVVKYNETLAWILSACSSITAPLHYSLVDCISFPPFV